MKIGIDIDDTMTDTKETFLMYQEKHNAQFDFYDEDFNNEKVLDFYTKYIEEIQLNAPLKKGVKKAFNYLKEKGWEIIIITARGGEFDYEFEKTTKEYFKKHNLPYDKIYFGNYPKGNVAHKEGVSLFIDDREYNLDDVSSFGIDCLHFTDEKSPYKKVDNWDKIIEYIEVNYEK